MINSITSQLFIIPALFKHFLWLYVTDDLVRETGWID